MILEENHAINNSLAPRYSHLMRCCHVCVRLGCARRVPCFWRDRPVFVKNKKYTVLGLGDITRYYSYMDCTVVVQYTILDICAAYGLPNGRVVRLLCWTSQHHVLVRINELPM